MRRLLLLLLVAPAFATTAITGNIQTLGATPGPRSFVRFTLRGCGGNAPTVSGVALISPTNGANYFIDFASDSSGNVSGTLYATRDSAGTAGGEISCGGSTTSVWYGMTAFGDGKAGPEVPVHAKNGTTLDISSVTPITTNPVITAPTGDTTYARLDGGNTPFSGAVSFSSTMNANNGGALGGTFSGNPTFSGNLTGTAGQNIFNAYNLNGALFVDGHKYPCTAAGIAQMLTDASGLANSEGCTGGFTSSAEIDIGGSLKTGVALRHPSTSTWVLNPGSGNCGIKMFTGNSFTGDGATTGGFVVQAQGGATMGSLLCTDNTVSTGNYTRTANLVLYNPSGATLSNGALDIENQADGTEFQNVTVANYSGFGAYVHSMCCSAHTIGLTANGNSTSGAIPLKFDADSTHLVVGNTFLASSIDHPGSGLSNMVLTGTNRFWCGTNNFFGLYMEGPLGTADNTTAAIDDNCFGSLLLAGVRLGNDTASSTRYLLKIESGSEGVTAFDLESGISTNIVNDLQNNVTVTTAAGYKPINYISVPTYVTNLNLAGPALRMNGGLLTSSNPPTVSSGFGTSPSVSSNNGSATFRINVGTGGTATTGVIAMNSTAKTGWNCQFTDVTTHSNFPQETAFTTTTVTVGGFNSAGTATAWTASDTLIANCTGF